MYVLLCCWPQDRVCIKKQCENIMCSFWWSTQLHELIGWCLPSFMQALVGFSAFIQAHVYLHTWYNTDFQATILNPFMISGCEGQGCSRGQPSSPPVPSLAVKSQQHSQDILGQFTQVRSPNSVDRKHRDASAVMPFIGLTGSKFTLSLSPRILL